MSDGSVACDHGPLDKGDGYCLACDLIESRDFWRTARAEEISVEIARLTSENERLRAVVLVCREWFESPGGDPDSGVILEQIEEVLASQKTATERN